MRIYIRPHAVEYMKILTPYTHLNILGDLMWYLPLKHEVEKGVRMRGGGLGSRPKKTYGESLGDGVEYHLMSPTPRR